VHLLPWLCKMLIKIVSSLHMDTTFGRFYHPSVTFVIVKVPLHKDTFLFQSSWLLGKLCKSAWRLW
jgi:hypothetical protein